MNWIDLLLIIIAALAVYTGVRRGFLIGIIDMFAWISGLLLCFYLYPFISQFLIKVIPPGIGRIAVSFLLTLGLIRIILYFLTGKMLNAIPVEYHETRFNKVLGSIPGLINGFVYCLFIVSFLVIFPFSTALKDKSEQSFLATRLIGVVSKVQAGITPFVEEVEKEAGTRLVTEKGEDKFVKLPFKVESPKRRPDLEAQMLNLINKERAKENLKPLKADPEIAEVALAHSADMFARGYFSHFSPEKKSPFDRISKAKVSFLTAGENLALAQTLQLAHDGLMRSPGHRANILHKAFGRVGIGILDGGIYGLMITQNFRN